MGRQVRIESKHPLDCLNFSEAELAVKVIGESLAKNYQLGAGFSFATTCTVEAWIEISENIPIQILKIILDIQQSDVVAAKILDIKYNEDGFTDDDGIFLFWGPMSDNVFKVLKTWMPNTPLGNVNIEEKPGSVIVTAIERYYYKVPDDYDSNNPIMSWSLSVTPNS